MVAKMKYISITGHIAAMNHVVSRYLSRYDIQLEKSASGLMEPFTTLNPYAQTFAKAEKLSKIVKFPPVMYMPMASAEAVNLVEEANAAYERRDGRLRELEERLADTGRRIESLQDFSSLDVDLDALREMEFTHFQFGKLAPEQFRRYAKFLQDDEKSIFITAKRDASYVYGAYFTPMPHKDAVQGVFASLEFKPLDFSREIGTPAAAIHHLRLEAAQMEQEIAALARDVLSGVCGGEKLAIACAKVKSLYAAFDVKKYAAISRGRRVFTFSGWMRAQDAETLEAEIESDDLALFARHVDENSNPPTLLKNLPIIRQFEFFTRLYGLPDYGEVDPTPLLAITYTLLFGLMFGDIGHGLVLAALGVLVKKRFHPNLGGIMTVVGVSAAAFGVLYGSAFGFEFSPVWRRPQADITGTLLFAAGLGAGLIALSMVLNMYNAFRRGRIGELLFGANGVAGLVFYSTVIWITVRILVQNRPFTWYVAAAAALPLVFVSLKHPLENYMAGRSARPQIFPMVIELFETLLTYATNTVSFVRVGAFAVSHAGMMHVVLQLGRGAAGANSWVILVVGNILVMFIEGLLVGIQVLRLDFYEIFSRFYKGGGQAFSSNRIETRR